VSTQGSSIKSQSNTLQIAISVEAVAYAAIFIAALCLRWIALGSLPLNDHEAHQAFASLSLNGDAAPDLGAVSSPMLYALTALVFQVTEASAATARIVPMLAGLVLVFSPLLLRERLGRIPTMVAMALLAVSPNMVLASRQVGGYTLMALGTVCTVAFLDRYIQSKNTGWVAAAGIAVGMCLISDYGALVSLLALLFGAAFAYFTDEEDLLTRNVLIDFLRAFPGGVFVIGLAATMLLLGTVFFLSPDGLGKVADVFGQFLGNIFRPIPGVAYLGLILMVYDAGILVFGMTGAWVAARSGDPFMRCLAGWGVGALMLSLMYQGTMPGHALWSIVPLSLLAGVAVSALIDLEPRGPLWMSIVMPAGFVGLCGVVLLFMVLHLKRPSTMTIPFNLDPSQASFVFSAEIFVASLMLLLLVVVILIVAGWLGPESALGGVGKGLLVIFVLAAVGQSGDMAFTNQSDPGGILRVDPAQPTLSILVETIEEVSQVAEGNVMDGSITAEASPDGALAWALRGFTDVTFVENIDPTIRTVIVIADGDSDPAVGSTYIGQDIVISREWSPRGLNPDQIARWLIYRDPPTQTLDHSVILWVRDDIYQLRPASDLP